MRLPVSRLSVLVLTAAALLSACASGPTIRSNADPSADFNRYTTYGFIDEVTGKPAQYTSFALQYLNGAISHEMELRGYKKAQDPQLLVNVNVATNDKLSVTQSPSTTAGYYGGYYGYRGGMYGWGAGVGYGTETNVQQYTEGTLNIDVVDAAQKKLLWEGVAIGRIKEKSLENPKPAIEKVVAQVFEKYPKPAPEAEAEAK